MTVRGILIKALRDMGADGLVVGDYDPGLVIGADDNTNCFCYRDEIEHCPFDPATMLTCKPGRKTIVDGREVITPMEDKATIEPQIGGLDIAKEAEDITTLLEISRIQGMAQDPDAYFGRPFIELGMEIAKDKGAEAP